MGVIFFGRITQAALALLALRVMTTMLTPKEMGRWSLLLAVAAFFVLGLVNPVGMFINRRLHGWIEHGKLKRYMRYYLYYLAGVALATALLIALSHVFYVAVPGVPLLWVISITVCTITFATLNQTYIPSLNLLGYRRWFVMLTLGTVAVGLIASVCLVNWVKATATLWIAGQLIGQGVFALLGGAVFFYLIKKHKQQYSNNEALLVTHAKLDVIFTFVWPLTISVLLTWIQSQSYRFIVQDVIGLQSLGLFVVGYGLSISLIGIFESVISTYFVPKFYERTASENKHEQSQAWREYAMAMLPSLLVIVAMIVSVSDELAHVLLDVKFSQAAQYIVWGALAEAARVTVGTYALLAHAGMNTKKLILPNVVGAISTPVLLFMLVPRWAAHGVGMALAASGLITVVASHAVLSRSFDIIVPWSRLFLACIIGLGFVLLSELIHGWFHVNDTLAPAVFWLFLMFFISFVTLYMFLKSQIRKEL